MAWSISSTRPPLPLAAKSIVKEGRNGCIRLKSNKALMTAPLFNPVTETPDLYTCGNIRDS